MMRLYAYFRSSASYRVRLALQHKTLPFELVTVHILKGEARTPEYLARNPLGQVPVLDAAQADRIDPVDVPGHQALKGILRARLGILLKQLHVVHGPTPPRPTDPLGPSAH